MSQSIPRGIEVLIKKASVDEAFKTLLLKDRMAAAAEIGMDLSTVEQAMLQAVPREQLAAIIARTSVPEQHRRAFLGQAAAAMLAVLGMTASAEAGVGIGGIRPEDIPPAPDKDSSSPSPPNLPVTDRVVEIIAAQMKLDKKDVHPDDKLAADLKVTPKDLKQIREDLEKEYSLKFPEAVFKGFKTVKQVITYVDSRVKVKKKADAASTSRSSPRKKIPERPYSGGWGMGGMGAGS